MKFLAFCELHAVFVHEVHDLVAQKGDHIRKAIAVDIAELGFCAEFIAVDLGYFDFDLVCPLAMTEVFAVLHSVFGEV